MSCKFLVTLSMTCLAVACTSSNAPRSARSGSSPPVTVPLSSFPPASSTPTVSTPAYRVTVDPASFVATIDNPHFPLAPGSQWVYQVVSEDETDRDEMVVTDRTKCILGVA